MREGGIWDYLRGEDGGGWSSSDAKDTAERRLGRGRKAARRRGREAGRTRAASARRTLSPPSTAAMRTSGLAIDGRRAGAGALGSLDAGAAGGGRRPIAALCSAQRKEPGCVVGEHAHALFRGGAGATGSARRRTDGAAGGGRGLAPAAVEDFVDFTALGGRRVVVVVTLAIIRGAARRR